MTRTLKLALVTFMLLAMVFFATACGSESTPYDDNNALIATWDELVNTYGMKADVDYTLDFEFTVEGDGIYETIIKTYETDTSSPYNVLTNTSALKNGTKLVIGNLTKIGSYAFAECESLESVTILDSVMGIGDSAFYDCTKLTSVMIPDSVVSISDDAFQYCESLKSILVDQNNPSYSGDGVALYNKDKTLLIQVLNGVTSFVIPNSVTNIGDYAFGSCTKLTSVTIPDSVVSIANGAFWYCESLTSLTIPDSVTSIGFSAFCGCRSLTSLTIPDSVTYIGGGVFANCDSLTTITFVGTTTQWNGISKDSWHTYIIDHEIKVICSDGTAKIVPGLIIVPPEW